MAAGTLASRTDRGTVGPTEIEKLTFETRGALLCRTIVSWIRVRCSLVRLAELCFVLDVLLELLLVDEPGRLSRS